MPTITTKNEKETLAFASRLARKLRGGDILLLQGELGSGKTTFVRGLARALGIKTRIKSPTFTLMHQYKIRNSKFEIRNLVHVDAYRVRNARELVDIGLLDWLGRPDTIVAVEWGEKIRPLLRGKKYKLIQFQPGQKENERLMRVF